MTTRIDRLAVLEPCPDHGSLHLRRSWPRGANHLLLEYERPDGSTVAGQWWVDAHEGARAAAATPGSSWLAPHGVMLQAHGRDRSLPRLAELVDEPGASLIVHRPERRAVVRRSDRRFTKVVPHRKAARILAIDRLARTTGAVEMPALLNADVAAGVLEWAEVPGRSLDNLLHDPTVPLAQVAVAGAATGSALRRLHNGDVPADLPPHTAAAEVETAASWLRSAVAHAAVPAGIDTALADAAAELTARGSPIVPIHRDLHEKQVIVEDQRAVLLDLDTLAAGEAALDVANFLVHLDLRVALGLPAERAVATATAFVDAYRPCRHVAERLAAHAAVTRLRLVCVYAFRPHQAERAARLLTTDADESLVRLA